MKSRTSAETIYAKQPANPKLDEVTISTQPIFEGKVISLQVDTVKLPNGQTATREIIKHPGAVAVLALKGDRMLVVDQYRQAMGRTEVEIPAGKLDPGEQPEIAAARELKEETGYTARSLRHLRSFTPHRALQTRLFICTSPKSWKPETWHWTRTSFLKYRRLRWRKPTS